MDRKQHWDRVFTSKGEQDVSWFEALPVVSLRMMEAAGLGPDTCVLDVGGGDSRLVDALVARGLDCLAVLDVSSAALHRAVFHFLTGADDRTRYRQHLRDTLKVAGTAIVATFALDGPEQCSGLPVVRYSADTLWRELGHEFQLIETVPHTHRTPWGTSQSFQYSRFVRVH
jgi:hypothetical protein